MFKVTACMATLSLVAPLCAAQSSSSTVTLWGRISGNLDSIRISGGSPGTARTNNQISNQKSRWGMFGVEDLGGGYSGKFYLESGFALNNGTITQGGTFWGRGAYVALGTPVGDFRLGRNTIPMGDDDFLFDPMQYGGLADAFPGYSTYINNSIKYVSKNYEGFNWRALYALHNPGTRLGQVTGLAATYAGGPVGAHLSYTETKIPPTPVVPNASINRREVLFGLSYNFGVVKPMLFVFESKDDGRPRLTNVLVGGTAPVGTGELRLSYTQAKQAAVKANRAALMFWQPLSKRTFVYADVAKATNNSTSTLLTLFQATTAGEDVGGVQFGIRHNF